MSMCRRECTVISTGGRRNQGSSKSEWKDKKWQGEEGKRKRPHFHPSMKANCHHRHGAVKEKIRARGNRFWGHWSRLFFRRVLKGTNTTWVKMNRKQEYVMGKSRSQQSKLRLGNRQKLHRQKIVEMKESEPCPSFHTKRSGSSYYSSR